MYRTPRAARTIDRQVVSACAAMPHCTFAKINAGRTFGTLGLGLGLGPGLGARG